MATSLAHAHRVPHTVKPPRRCPHCGSTRLIRKGIVIDTSRIATDTIDYVATDTAGLTATSTRTVLIEAAATLSSQ